MKDAKKIFIVEDEIIIAEGLQRKLKSMEYDIIGIASSGEEAIKKIKENNPDLILMDIVIHGIMITENNQVIASYIESFLNEKETKDLLFSAIKNDIGKFNMTIST